MHFVISDKTCNHWNKQIYSQIVICEKTYNEVTEFIENGKCILINSLPCEYYAKDHIHNSYNLFNKDVKKMSLSKIKDWMRFIVNQHYPKIADLLNKKKITIEEIPIICYCAHKKCNAAYLTALELLKKGFIRVDEYKGGMEEYNKKNV